MVDEHSLFQIFLLFIRPLSDSTHLFISFVFFIAALLLTDFLLKLIQGDNKFFVECAGGDA